MVGPCERSQKTHDCGWVSFLNAPVSGIFISQAKHGDCLKHGDAVGLIVDPLEGTIRERLKAPTDGVLFTIREYPVVDEGSLIARILKRQTDLQEK